MADDDFVSVIDNLVRNAIVHGKTDKMDIIMEDKDVICEIRVVDCGVGISDEIKERVFKEGFTYDENKVTGLGVYIVRKTLERYVGVST